MKVHKSDTVVCPTCGEEHYEARFMIDPMSPYIPHMTDCSECGEPFQVVKLDDQYYDVAWA